jgi:hypothetical protein
LFHDCSAPLPPTRCQEPSPLDLWHTDHPTISIALPVSLRGTWTYPQFTKPSHIPHHETHQLFCPQVNSRPPLNAANGTPAGFFDRVRHKGAWCSQMIIFLSSHDQNSPIVGQRTPRTCKIPKVFWPTTSIFRAKGCRRSLQNPAPTRSLHTIAHLRG